MITILDIHKNFGRQELFRGASLQINPKDRYALVGKNGAGKSTLMRMLLGEMEPDQGEIQIRRGLAIGYLPQENADFAEKTVLEEALAHHEDPDGKYTSKAKSILMGLGFRISDFDREMKALSGGWAMRVAIARLLLQEPDLLMLDEPTNHLDLDSLLWFQEYLKNYIGAIFLISHDRNFINTVCNAIVNVEDGYLKPYYGNYDYFLSERKIQRERLEAAYAAQQNEIEEMQEFINRNRARASTASRAQSVIKRLEKVVRIELPEESRKMKIRFPQPERTGISALVLKNLSKSYGDLKVYQGLDFELERGWKVGFVGHNGAGKSTLLKICAGVIPFDSGERNLGLNVKVGYFSQIRTEMLDPEKTVFEEAAGDTTKHSEQTIRSVLGSFLFPGETVFKKVKVLSGGEKSRLALVKLLLDPPNLLLMDEPTTHLDLQSVDALVDALRGFEGTLCFISHDLYFINALADHVVHVDQGKVSFYPGNYEYFKRRQQQMAEDALAEAPEQVVEEKPVVKHRLNPKEERRRRALEREQLRTGKPGGSESIGSNGAANAERISELTKLLEDPAIYQDFAKVREITAELKALQSP